MAPRGRPKKSAEPITQDQADSVVEEIVEQDNVQTLDIAALRADVYKTMGLKVYTPEFKHVLKTEWPLLDKTIGTPEGIPYGRMVELSGPESHGKSVIKTVLIGAAQRDGAIAIEGDIEESYDPQWFDKLGCDSNAIIPVQPKMVYEGLSTQQKEENSQARAEWKEKPVAYRKKHPFVAPYALGANSPKRMQTAQEIFEEMENLVKKLHSAGAEKMILTIDSIANLATEAQIKAGMHQNMRTNVDLPTFLNGALKQWQIMLANYNVLAVFTNQIRERPGVMFGDPTYEPGGRALRHNCQSRNRVNRIGDGKIYQAGKLAGIRTAIKNKKNKTGEGSIEGGMCEVSVRFDNKPMILTDRIKVIPFVSKKQKEKQGEAE